MTSWKVSIFIVSCRPATCHSKSWTPMISNLGFLHGSLELNKLKWRIFVSLFLTLISRWGSGVQTTIVIIWRTSGVYIKTNTFVFCTGTLFITFPFLPNLRPLIFWVIPNSLRYSCNAGPESLTHSTVNTTFTVNTTLHFWRRKILIKPGFQRSLYKIYQQI